MPATPQYSKDLTLGVYPFQESPHWTRYPVTYPYGRGMSIDFMILHDTGKPHKSEVPQGFLDLMGLHET
jgi:hypothetical protein